MKTWRKTMVSRLGKPGWMLLGGLLLLTGVAPLSAQSSCSQCAVEVAWCFDTCGGPGSTSCDICQDLYDSCTARTVASSDTTCQPPRLIGETFGPPYCAGQNRCQLVTRRYSCVCKTTTTYCDGRTTTTHFDEINTETEETCRLWPECVDDDDF